MSSKRKSPPTKLAESVAPETTTTTMLCEDVLLGAGLGFGPGARLGARLAAGLGPRLAGGGAPGGCFSPAGSPAGSPYRGLPSPAPSASPARSPQRSPLRSPMGSAVEDGYPSGSPSPESPGAPVDSDQDDAHLDVGDASDGPGAKRKSGDARAEPYPSKKARLEDAFYLYNNNNSSSVNNNNHMRGKAVDKRSMDSVLRKLGMQAGKRSPSPGQQQPDGEAVERQLREMIEHLELARRRLLGDQRAQRAQQAHREDHILQEAEAVQPSCTRVAAPARAAARCGGDQQEQEEASHRETDKAGSGRGGGQRSHAPCDCPCWAAYSPAPPASLATGDIYRTCRLPKRFQYPVWFSGYNSGPKHPLYRTTASDIGRFPPTVHTVSTIYRPVDRTVSKLLSAAGPWRNRSLCNTGSIWDAYSYHNFY